jgi:hypothetical protein
MQITVEIPDELAAQAQASGLTPESYVKSLLDRAMRTPAGSLPSAKPNVDIEEFIREMAANSENMPQLPDEAFTRESLYQDHD